MKRALILTGGWEGHQPEVFAARLAAALAAQGIEAHSVSSLEALDTPESLRPWDIIIPNWTMGELTPDQTAHLSAAIRDGKALAGMHGGMGDAFRGNLEYEWMVGGHFVGHPHVGCYTVRVHPHEITQGLPAEFPYESEQYYLLTDPGNQILAETVYEYEGRKIPMPVAWTKLWGQGRVFYSSLGHAPSELDDFPEALTLATRGILWAAGILDS